MSIIDRLKETFASDEHSEETGVEYQCAACGTVFDTAHERCPECGESDIRERGSFEFRPE